MTPSVSGAAERELIDGAVYYLCLHPLAGVEWRDQRRRFPLRRFPYSIIYYLRNTELRVVAIAHHRRRPEYWAGRT